MRDTGQLVPTRARQDERGPRTVEELIRKGVPVLRWPREAVEELRREGVIPEQGRKIVLRALGGMDHAVIPGNAASTLAAALEGREVIAPAGRAWLLKLGPVERLLACEHEPSMPDGPGSLCVLSWTEAADLLTASGQPVDDATLHVAACASSRTMREERRVVLDRAATMEPRRPELPGHIAHLMPSQLPWMTDAELMASGIARIEAACDAWEAELDKVDRERPGLIAELRALIGRAGWLADHDIELPAVEQAVEALERWEDKQSKPPPLHVVHTLIAAIEDELRAVHYGHSNPRFRRRDPAVPCAQTRIYHLAATRGAAERLAAAMAAPMPGGLIVWGRREKSWKGTSYGTFPLHSSAAHAFDPYWQSFRLFRVVPTHGLVTYERAERAPNWGDVPSRVHASAIRVVEELGWWEILGNGAAAVRDIVNRARHLTRAEIIALGHAREAAIAKGDGPWKLAMAAAERDAAERGLVGPFQWVFTRVRELVIGWHGEQSRSAAIAVAAAAQAAVVGFDPDGGRIAFLPGYEPLVAAWLEVIA